MPIPTPDGAIVDNATQTISVRSLAGDVIFKDLIIQSATDVGDVEISVDAVEDSDIEITPRLVTSWYQAGITTRKENQGGVLTYELLIADDRMDPGEGHWVQSERGGWIYHPPDIELSDMLFTRLASNTPRRLLLRFEVPATVAAGVYPTKIFVRTSGTSNRVVGSIPIKIVVSPVSLTHSLDELYTLALYTAFKLNNSEERPGAYVNSMRLAGDQGQRLSVLQSYLYDIRRHGFNGITIHDWDRFNLGTTLDLANKLGIRNVILHATTPTNLKTQGDQFPIVNKAVIDQFVSRDMVPQFYGYDEIGGNRRLLDQLSLNREIHRMGGRSVNAVFWDDLPKAQTSIGSDVSSCFDVVAHSLGSHGNVSMLKSLPFIKTVPACPNANTRHLVYWHPHVENPTINRLFMGFWLWASGFDGVIPHGYYFPSHIEKILTPEDRRRGISNASSPYDDWAYWLPGEPLRHHNAVYPSQSGPVGTLQWEGVLDGHTDLKYVVTLEELLERQAIGPAARTHIRSLLDDIQADVLQIRSPYLDDDRSLRYLRKLEYWRSSIVELLRTYSGPTRN